MKKSFYVNICKALIVKVNADIQTQEIFENYFDCKFEDKYSDSIVDYVIEYCGTIQANIQVPPQATMVHAFLGAEYYIWQQGNKFCAYAQDGQLKGFHYCEREGKHISVYVGNIDERDIVFRMYRELMFRHLLSLGYVPMHATASVDKDNMASVFFGCRNAGKTVMLCSHIHNLHENPLATDVIMLKYSEDCMYCCGIPIKFSYDPKMLELFNLKESSVFPENKSKHRIFNSEFNKLFNCKSVWETKRIKSFQNILFAKDAKLDVKNTLIQPSTYVEYMDNWHFGDFLQLMPNFEVDLENTYRYVKYSLIRGDFPKYVK